MPSGRGSSSRARSSRLSRKLKRDLGVAFNTVLRAYSDLTRMGLAYTVPATGVYVSPGAPATTPSDDPGRERMHFLKLTDAFIAQSERCGYDIDSALSEVRLRARIRRRKLAAKELERQMRGERREEAEPRGRRRPKPPG